MRSSILFFVSVLLFFSSCESESPQSATTTNKNEVLAVDGMVLIPGGTLKMGQAEGQADPDEYPKHEVPIESFWMDETEVTNAQFKAFIDATGYITIAERAIDWEELKKNVPPGTPKPADSLLAPGAVVFQATQTPVALDNPTLWWRWVIGANWQHPLGPESTITDIMDHPVVQVAWEDAIAYAEWAGKRLPTEAEWEWAARGGLEGTLYPWGNETVEKAYTKANFWQGMFPYQNEEKDGYYGTAPVKSFPPNGYGLYDMAGNVWEWCQDWYDFDFYKKEEAAQKNTDGPEQAYNPAAPYLAEKVVRGGSFLCNDAYCSGYRNARRMKSSPDTGLNHTGFRCIKSVEGK